MAFLPKIKDLTAALLPKTRSVIFIAPLICLLSSCGQWYWVSHKKPITSLNKDILDCQHKANLQFPPHIYQETAPNYGAVMYNSYQQSQANQYSTPESYDTDTDCHRLGSSLRCHSTSVRNPAYTPTPIHIPEQTVVTRDANQGVRDQAFTKCMSDGTWNLEYRERFAIPQASSFGNWLKS